MSKKQDRTAVRTAKELEQKYNLGQAGYSDQKMAAMYNRLLAEVQGKFVPLSGGVVTGCLAVGSDFKNVVGGTVGAASEILIKTEIPYAEQSAMLRIYGTDVDLTITLNAEQRSVVSRGIDTPTVKLCAYTKDEVQYMAIGLVGVFEQFSFMVDWFGGKREQEGGWNFETNNTEESLIPADSITVPCKAASTLTVGTTSITEAQLKALLALL